MLRFALDGITSFSTVPVQLIAWLGFAIVVFCFAVLGWALYTRFFTNEATPGWTSLLVVVLLLGGVQLLSLGIIGQYVARIFDINQHTLYYVDEQFGSADHRRSGGCRKRPRTRAASGSDMRCPAPPR